MPMDKENKQQSDAYAKWTINTNEEELRDLKYKHERYFDFWEWYENEYGQSAKELWGEFEKWEDAQYAKLKS